MVKIKKQKKSGERALERLFICPSHECNANCVHCYEKFLHDKFHNSLSASQVKKLIDQFHELGGQHVYFCSGEFLLRLDALELINYAHQKPLFVTVNSNGLLVDEAKIKELKRAGLSELIVSIDSVNPARHDKLRGVKGCFKKATRALALARKEGILTQIWTYVSRSNSKELPAIGNLGEKLGVSSVFVFFTLLSGHLFNRPEENLTLAEREEFRKKFNNDKTIVLEMADEKSYCAGGGGKHLNVMPSGDVTFCPPVPYSYGNIKEKSLAECLAAARQDHQKFSHCTGQCIINFPEYRQNCKARFIYE